MISSKINKISIVIPIYNEQDSLPELIRRTIISCKKINVNDYEIILIDDGSNDNSANIISMAAKIENNHIIGVLLKRNYGQHNAIMAGLNYITGDLVITLDGDLQNPPEEIFNLVKTASCGYDVVGTIRQNRQDNLFRKYSSKFANYIIRQATGKEMKDYGCMLRAYRIYVIHAIMKCYKKNIFIPILANIFAKKTIEISVTHTEREHGSSKYGLLKLLNLMYDLLICLTYNSLRMLGIIGVILVAFGLFLSLLIIILHLFMNFIWIIDVLLLIITILFIIIGMQFILAVFIGEYIYSMTCNTHNTHQSKYYVKCVISKNNILSQRRNKK